MYLEPWHADIMSFVDLRRNGGSSENHATSSSRSGFRCSCDAWRRRRLEPLCPNEARPTDVCGAEFDELYERYEREGGTERRSPRQLMNRIIDAQIETGTPYFLYKDSANQKSNQRHLQGHQSSNLCAEIIEYSSARGRGLQPRVAVPPQFMTNDGFSHGRWRT
jgi:ribonucleoside-diphosphate reductase alpha chain